MIAENFGESWLIVDLPFPCEIHHCQVKATPRPERYRVLNLVGEPSPLMLSVDQVRKIAKYFDLILTRHNELLDLENAKFLTFGSTWIKETPKKKCFDISFLYSAGIHADFDGYLLRQQIWERKSLIKIPQRFYTSALPNRVPKIIDINPYPYDSKDSLFESMFSICVENCSEVNFFTEKIIDAFRTYTIPIYYGCPNIQDFFNPEGIVNFERADQLIEIINSLTPEFYWGKMQPLIENHQRSSEYADFNNRLKRAIIYQKSIFNDSKPS